MLSTVPSCLQLHSPNDLEKKMILRYYIHTKTQTYTYKLLSDQKKYMEKQESSGGWKFLMHIHLNRKICNSTIHVSKCTFQRNNVKRCLLYFCFNIFAEILGSAVVRRIVSSIKYLIPFNSESFSTISWRIIRLHYFTSFTATLKNTIALSYLQKIHHNYRYYFKTNVEVLSLRNHLHF